MFKILNFLGISCSVLFCSVNFRLICISTLPFISASDYLSYSIHSTLSESISIFPGFHPFPSSYTLSEYFLFFPFYISPSLPCLSFPILRLFPLAHLHLQLIGKPTLLYYTLSSSIILYFYLFLLFLPYIILLIALHFLLFDTLTEPHWQMSSKRD